MPTESQIHSLHQKYSHGKYRTQLVDLVWTHSQIVQEISFQIRDNLKNKYKIAVDTDMLSSGALIHDIGFYSCFDDNFKKIEKYNLHNQFGYKIAKAEKLPEPLARFCLVHTGVGITPNIPITLEEEIVTYADCFHSKGRPHFNSYSEIETSEIKYSPDNGVVLRRFQDKFGLPNLTEMEIKYRSWHQQINKILEDMYQNQ
jgi:HD superfamily phosphodiesterase